MPNNAGATSDDVLGLVAFTRVVEHHTFTAAAGSLGISRSALSERIASLEERLGLRLLHRTTRRVSLTVDGMRIYQRCAGLSSMADDAVALAVESRERPRGVLRVSAPVGLGERYLFEPIAELAERYPDLRVDLRLTDGLVDLVEGGYDVAVRMTGRLEGEGLVARRVATDRLVVCAGAKYVEAHGAPTSPEDLVRHRAIRYALLRAEDEWRFRGPRGVQSVPVREVLASDNAAFIRGAVLVGIGTAVLPESLIADDLARGSIVPVAGRLANDALGIHLVHAHARTVPARVRVFVEHVARAFRRPPWQRALEAREPAPSPKKSRSSRR